MSWLFSQALAVEFSAGTSLDGELSAPSSGSPIPQAFLSHGKTTDFSRPSRFGMTFRPLTDAYGEELLMSYLAAFRARTFQSQARVPAWTEREAACGGTWRGWLAKYDPDSSSWKTAQCSFIEDSTESSVTFPRSGMTRDGLLWEQPMWERRTSGTGSGLWPTPVASDTSSRNTPYAQGGTPLSLAVKIWPTPTAGADCLGAFGGSGARKKMATLVSDSELFGPLNPTFPEWLMGWPLGWTDLKPLETARCLSAPPQPGDCSPLEEAA